MVTPVTVQVLEEVLLMVVFMQVVGFLSAIGIVLALGVGPTLMERWKGRRGRK